MPTSLFYTFRVYVKQGIKVVHFEDCDLTNVESVKARLRMQYPECTVREKTMQKG